MAHKQAKKQQHEYLGQEEICTFSAVGQTYDREKFTPKKCLKRKGLKRELRF